MDLALDTKRLLRAARKQKTLAQIADAAGAPVTYEWLKKFVGPLGHDSTVSRVQHLHDHLVSVGAKQSNNGKGSTRAAAG